MVTINLTTLFSSGVLSLMTLINTDIYARELADNEPVDIIVTVSKIDQSKPGNILIMLYGQDGFPKDHAKATQIKVMKAVTESVTVGFSSVPAEFAIKILHDEDLSGQVSKNWTGIIPAEGLGFSNGAKLSFGPPSFEVAKLTLKNTIKPLNIDVIYP